MGFNTKGKLCGSGFRGYPDRPGWRGHIYMELLMYMFGKDLAAIRKELRKNKVSVRDTASVSKFIKRKLLYVERLLSDLGA